MEPTDSIKSDWETTTAPLKTTTTNGNKIYGMSSKIIDVKIPTSRKK